MIASRRSDHDSRRVMIGGRSRCLCVAARVHGLRRVMVSERVGPSEARLDFTGVRSGLLCTRGLARYIASVRPGPQDGGSAVARFVLPSDGRLKPAAAMLQGVLA